MTVHIMDSSVRTKVQIEVKDFFRLVYEKLHTVIDFSEIISSLGFGTLTKSLMHSFFQSQ